MYSQQDIYISHVINNTNPKKTYTKLDLEVIKSDHEKGLCPQSVIDFVEPRVIDPGIDAFDLAKKIEEVWRESLLQSIASGAMSGKDVKSINVYIKYPTGEYLQVKDAYSHHGMGVILDVM